MPNNYMLPDPDLTDPRVSYWQWLRAHCKLTWGSALIWLAPFVATFAFEDRWKLVATICIPIGVVLSHGKWRRFLGAALWIGIVLWGGPYRAAGDGTGIVPGFVGLLWAVGLGVTSYADGQKWRSKQVSESEEWS
jgi:hypothetical protein